MNKHTFLALALLFSISFKAYASDIVPQTSPTLMVRVQSLIVALAAVPQVAYSDLNSEPMVQFVKNTANASMAMVSGTLSSAQDAVAHGFKNTSASVASVPGATLSFVKANPYSLTLAALVIAGSYAGYKYATAPKSYKPCKCL
ncbi:MAG: hypothetical protein K2X90_04390 [Candidatus Babeliaceae bacterium]|nr:hypothetical protein [Candidatus Babeliaceae bacterium]